MNMKVILLVLLLLIIIFLSLLFLPSVLIYVVNLFEKSPEKPAITYGEFPFRLEYEINGRREFMEDTLIIEYKGVGIDAGRGKFRRWEDRLASGNERITLFKSDLIEIYYPHGGSKYYMGDLEEYVSFNPAFPNAAYMTIEKNITQSGIITEDDLMEQYGIQLMSWDIADPIVNSFK